jgi:hypothetical protein
MAALQKTEMNEINETSEITKEPEAPKPGEWGYLPPEAKILLNGPETALAKIVNALIASPHGGEFDLPGTISLEEVFEATVRPLLSKGENVSVNFEFADGSVNPTKVKISINERNVSDKSETKSEIEKPKSKPNLFNSY